MNRRVELAVYSAFFLSGVAGLVYQVAWSRYLGILLGGTGTATIIVLATFMGGLGAGAWLFGGAADREGSKVKLYAWLELGIGAWGGLYPFLFPFWTWTFHSAAAGAEPGGAVSTSLKALIAVASILPGTLLMGGTLPVLGKFLIRSLALVGDRVAKLYFINSVGAVAGSLLAGFWLIRRFGLDGSMFLAAGANLFVALIAFSLAGVERSLAETAPETAPEAAKASSKPKKKKAPGSKRKSVGPRKPSLADADGAEVYPRFNATVALWVIAISGAINMMYEVVWIRMLALALGSSTYTFSLVVAAFILGISIGSFILAFKRDDRGYYEILGLCELFIGIALLLTLPIFLKIPWWLNQAKGALAPTPEGFPLYQALKFALAFAVMLPPTIFIGMTLPAASKVVAREMSTLGRRVGSAFAVNTFGAIAGAILGGAVVMPALGVKGALLLGIALNVVLGLAVLLTVPRGGRRFTANPLAWIAMAGLGAFGFAMLTTSWHDRFLQRPVFRKSQPFASYQEYLGYIGSGETLFHRDGLDCSVSVIEWPDGGRTVYTNGKPDASVGPDDDPAAKGSDLVYNLLLAHLPLISHPNPENVLVVGVASGATAGAASTYPDVQVDVAELSPDMAHIAEYFASCNREFYGKDNCRVIIEDAKTILALSDRDYDVIITEPSNPWFGSNAALFTSDFYELCRSRLAPGGLMAQWLQTYEIDDESAWQILRTLQGTFPYVAIWETGSSNVALICSPEPFEPDLALMFERFQLPGAREDMRLLGLDGFETLLRLQMIDLGRSGADLAGPGPVNSDMRPTLEFAAPLGFYLDKPSRVAPMLDLRGSASGRETLCFGRQALPAGAGELPADRWRAAAESLGKRHSHWSGYLDWICDQWAAQHPADPWPEVFRASGKIANNHAELLEKLSGPRFEAISGDPLYRERYLDILGDYHFKAKDAPKLPDEALERSVAWMNGWKEVSEEGWDEASSTPRRQKMAGLGLWRLGRAGESAEVFEGMLAGMERRAEEDEDFRRDYEEELLLLQLASRSRLDAGEPAKAAKLLDRYDAILGGRSDASGRQLRTRIVSALDKASAASAAKAPSAEE